MIRFTLREAVTAWNALNGQSGQDGLMHRPARAEFTLWLARAWRQLEPEVMGLKAALDRGPPTEETAALLEHAIELPLTPWPAERLDGMSMSAAEIIALGALIEDHGPQTED